MSYIDGFVVPVPTDKKEEYRAIAEIAAAVFRDHGATEVVEAWGVDTPVGEVTSFPRAVQLQENETAVFSWVIWPSKEVRDAGNPKVMEDPRMKIDPASMPFDGKRMIYGSFETLLRR